MDQLMIDVTQIRDVKTADEVTIIGDDGGNTLLAPDIAHRSGTITNELLSNMGKRLPVIVC